MATVASPPRRTAEVLEEEVQRLQDEVELLNTAAREDQRDLKELKTAADLAEHKAALAERRCKEKDSHIQQLQSEIYTISNREFQAQTTAKKLEVKATALPDVEQERNLLAQQADKDAATIRALERELNEVAYARDRALERAAKAEEEREEATGNSELLEHHAAQLRASNAELAQRCADLEAELQRIQGEGIGDWFVRNGRADQAKLTELRRQKQLIPEASGHASSSNVTSPQGISSAPAAGRYAGRPPAVQDDAPGPNAAAMMGRYDDISGQVLGSTMMTATGMSHAPPSALRSPRDSDDDDDDDNDDVRDIDDRLNRDAPHSRGSGFSTVRSLRKHHQRDQPAIEAIYGEKGVGDERMYLVKTRGADGESWVPAGDVDPCSALSAWRAAKAQEREQRGGPRSYA